MFNTETAFTTTCTPITQTLLYRGWQYRGCQRHPHFFGKYLPLSNSDVGEIFHIMFSLYLCGTLRFAYLALTLFYMVSAIPDTNKTSNINSDIYCSVLEALWQVKYVYDQRESKSGEYYNMVVYTCKYSPLIDASIMQILP